MCVAFIAIDDTHVVVAFNRDERLARETLAVHAFAGEDIIAGKDCEGGGTWLGVNKNTGAFALLTNARVIGHGDGAREREHDDDDYDYARDCAGGTSRMDVEGEDDDDDDACASLKYRTRGELVTDYLRAECECIETYAKEVFERRFSYDAFNLILGDNRGAAYYVGNRGEANHVGPMQLAPGKVYGLANDTLDSPGWVKVDNGKAAMEKILAERRAAAPTLGHANFQALEEAILRDVLHAPLFDDDVSSSGDIHRRTPAQRSAQYHTVECHPKRAKSAFVRAGEIPGAPDVVTRSSTVVVLARDGRASWREANWDFLHAAHASGMNGGTSINTGRDSPSSSSGDPRAGARVRALVFRVPEIRRPKSIHRDPSRARHAAA
mmetsp:Transcript_7511/g.27422  ORF Transcript_7511/g.27422 Transcript_7511/m.27422 type:complete len:380 (-) Transcript_7511:2376-3515(-)